mgnify:CR=1 FL=1
MSEQPANIEAEAAFLGAVLIHNDVLDALPVSIAPEHFFEPLHGRILERVLALRGRGQVVSPVTLKPYFEADASILQLGGIKYLAALTADGQGLLNARELATQIVDLAQRRSLLGQLAEVNAALLDPATPMPDFSALATQGSFTNEGLCAIDLAAWHGPPPVRQSLWGELLPLLQTTLLTGTGGVGKSLLAQALCTHVALGRPFLGYETCRRNAVYLTSEDDADELWRRQHAICQVMNLPIADLIDRLHVISLAGEDETALVTIDPSGRMVATSKWRSLEALGERCDIGLFAIDNAADAMAGDHNDLHAVAAFVNRLTGLALRRRGAALLLGHPNKSGDDWLGSVAWHNKVRSRLLLRRADNGDSDARVLEAPKANYGPSGGQLELRWHRGAFIRDDDLPEDYRAELAASVRVSGENAAFLACLRACEHQGDARAVGPSPGPNYAPSQFEGMPQAKGFDRTALKRAMERLATLGQIEFVTVRNQAKGRDVTVIKEIGGSSPNASPNASRTLFPNHPEPRPERPRIHSPHTSYGRAGPNGAPPPEDDPDQDWGGEFDEPELGK